MNMIYSICKKVNNLICCIGNSCLSHSRRIASKLINKRNESARHIRARKLDRAVDLIAVCDRHNSGNHGNGDARLTNLIEEVVEQIVVKEHLCSKEITSRVYLFLKVLYILTLIFTLRVLCFQPCFTKVCTLSAYNLEQDYEADLAIDTTIKKMKIKLIIIDSHDEEEYPEQLEYFIDTETGF